MVEFTLPKNSKITQGKTWPRKPSAKRETEVRVYRWDPEDGQNPRVDTYYVDRDDCGPMVLDALIWIKNNIDPTLTFRRSCREGVCGSCAMNIDGTNTLACTKAMDDAKEPLQDLSAAASAGGEGPGAGPDEFLRAIRLDRALAARRRRRRRRRNGSRATKTARSSTACTNASSAPAARPRARAIGGIRDRYLGPAALLQANRWVQDSRDEATGERLDNLEDPFRLYRCHTIMNCAKACPKGLNPAKAIAEMKKAMVDRQV